MAAQIADVSDIDGKIISRLPLDVQGVVDRVRKFVFSIIDGEGKELRSALNLAY